MLYAFILGVIDRFRGECFGRTWNDDQSKNEAYDRGRNLAEAIVG